MITKDEIKKKVESGEYYTKPYCFMTGEEGVADCYNCHDYACPVNNGTADVSLEGVYETGSNNYIGDMADFRD